VKGPIERKISDATGRHFEMAHLDVKYRWPPRIVASGVRFDNPAWAREKQMLTADEIAFTISIPPLFHKEVVMPTSGSLRRSSRCRSVTKARRTGCCTPTSRRRPKARPRSRRRCST